MSRIGKLNIIIPANVNVKYTKADGSVEVSGPNGCTKDVFRKDILVNLNDKNISLEIDKNVSDIKLSNVLHGLYRSLLQNMIIGVSSGFKKELELIGVGYKASVIQGNILELDLGLSHKILFELPKEVTCKVEAEKGKNILIILNSVSKCLVGQIASKIRSLRPVEPYKGKGFRYVGEYVRKKIGKAAAK